MALQEKELTTYFLEKAQESFRSESLLYKQMENNIYYSVDKLYFSLKDPMGFKKFQDELQKAVYGENAEWIQYLYDRTVIKNIVTTGSAKITDLYKIGGKNYSTEYFSVGQIRSKKGNVTSEQVRAQIKKLAADLTDNFKEMYDRTDINNSKEFEAMIAEIRQGITRGLMLNGFRAKFKQDDATHLSGKTRVNIFTLSEEDENKYVFTSPKITEIYLRQEELVDVIQKSTKDIVNKYKDVLGISYTTSTSTFTAAINFINDSGFLKRDVKNASSQDLEQIQRWVYENAENIAAKFLEEIVYAINQAHPGKSTGNIFSYQSTLASMIQKDAHLAMEIYKANTESSVSGTLGEILFAALLTAMKMEEKTVQILGQEITTSGSAAVDVLLTKKEGDLIQKAGFQLKNYSSVQDEVVLYSQANKFYGGSGDKNAMERYIESSTLSELYKLAREIFIERSMPFGSNVATGGDHFNTLRNVLAQSIPNYIRYDQADLTDDSFGKNNFYVINFQFIPASVIFYTLAVSLLEQEKYLEKQNMFFFQGMHGAKSKHGNLLSGYPDDLADSWDRSWMTIRDAKLGELGKNKLLDPYPEDVPNVWKENLYLNFKGVQIKFKNALSILWSNAQR